MNISSLHSQTVAPEMPVERLADNAAMSEQEKIGELSKQFESLLVRQILAEAQKPVFQSKYADNSFAGSIYRDLNVQHLADGISQAGGLGLAGVLQQQLTKQVPTS
jgi:Rod binding domain-containing protein